MNRACYFALVLLCFAPITPALAQNLFKNLKEIPETAGYRIVPLPGDYDGDGDLDLLGTGMNSRGGTAWNATALWRNDGDHYVLLDLDLVWFYNGGMYQWADLDNDNDLDIIASGCPSDCYNSKGVFIYRNDGADQFTRITTPTNITPGKAFTLADYNNDGLIDIEMATTDPNDYTAREFYVNKGDFTFQKTFQLGTIGGETAWGDLNNDGLIDFVLYNHAYKNLGNGTFEVFPSPDAMQPNPKHFIFDEDNDGDNDVITSNAIIMRNDGNGVLTFSSLLVPYSGINNIIHGDFDGDGDKDRLVTGGDGSGSKNQLFRSNGDGTYSVEDLSEEFYGAMMLSVADVDHDNDPDLIVSGTFTFNVSYLENVGTSTLSKPTPPVNLQVTEDADNFIFSWGAGTDAESNSLSYNLYLSRSDNFVITPNADLGTGFGSITTKINGSSSLNYKVPKKLMTDGYYEWSVQTVDLEYNRSAFAMPKTLTYYKTNPAYAPIALQATNVTTNSITLGWSDQSSNETSFSIERSSTDGNSGFQAINSVEANVETFINNSLPSNTVYYYRIRFNGPAAAAYTNVIKVKTAPAIVDTPTNLFATSVTSAKVNLQWSFGSATITGFRVERSFDDLYNFAPVATTGPTTLAFSEQQLEPGKTYYYRVVAINGNDASDPSNTLKVTMPLKELEKVTLPSLSYEQINAYGSMSWGDYDNDGFDDVFISMKSQLFHNKGNGEFEPVSSTGIRPSSDYNTVAVWGDYDNDGFLDLYCYNDVDRGTLYHGNGTGIFSEVITVINSDRNSVLNATWVDYDMDGDLDLSTSAGLYLYRYDGNNIFTRVDYPLDPSSYDLPAVASWGDFDDDGDPDLFVGSNGKDKFFRNNGDGSLTEITDQRVTKDYNFDCCPIQTATAIWNDFNNDQKLDLSVLHGDGPLYLYSNHENVLDSSFYSYEYNRQYGALSWTDYDSDGDQDLFILGTYYSQNAIWENTTGNVLKRLRGGPLYFYSVSDAKFSWNDYDNNGFPDLFSFDSNHSVYKNLPNGNSWIKIRLRGRQSNSTGLGAKVFVKAQDKWQRVDVTTHHSVKIQQGFMSLIGLGNNTVVDSVKILWPSGNKQYLTNVSVNQVILMDENDAQEKVVQGPSNLIAEVEFPSAVILSWTDRSDSETGFTIEMGTADIPFTAKGTVNANVTSFKVTGLSLGINYKFRVRANGAGDARTSNVAETQIKLFTPVSGIDLTAPYSSPDGVAWGDVDNDGDPDVFVGAQSFEPDALYYNNGGAFKRVALSTNTVGYSKQAQWVDYNQDGHLDLHVSVGGGISGSPEYLNDMLYLNDGTGQLVMQGDNTIVQDGRADYSAAWGDFNNDKFPDMIAARAESGVSPVFLNLGGNFLHQTDANQNLALPNFIALSDYDNDRDLDIVTASDVTNGPSIFSNQSGIFTQLTQQFGFSGRPFVFEDFDNDGRFDLAMITSSSTVKIYVFDHYSGLYQEKTGALPVMTGYIWALASGDFDNNGFVDIIVVRSNSFPQMFTVVLLNQGDGTFTTLENSFPEDEIVNVAIADFNKDGRLDAFAVNSRGSFNTNRYLLKGNKTGNHWLRVKLKGVQTNTSGLGAKIRVIDNDINEVREVRSGSGSTFNDEQVAHFGLGSQTSIDYIKIEWPSGIDQWIANPAIDAELVIEEEETEGPARPAGPTNLTAANVEPGYIELNWSDNSDNEISFRIERAVDNGNFSLFKVVPPNTTSYTDSSFFRHFPERLELKYRVVAKRMETVESDPSNVAALSIVTGLHDEANNLNIYPQPASSRVFVSGNETIRAIELIGMRGESVRKLSDVNSPEAEIQLEGLTPGMYVIRIKTDSGTKSRKLIVSSTN